MLSKRGLCSRREAALWIVAGRVRVDGRMVCDPEHPTDAAHASIRIDGVAVAAASRVYLALNKPRGLVTTARDEQGRDTVYRCLDGTQFGWLAPVGRLDRASEGLLLFSNDPAWAAAIASPDTGPDKTYHVQIDRIPDATLLRRLETGVPDPDGGAPLRAKSVTLLRAGEKNAWLAVVLDEGRNRQIRRLLAAVDIGVLRLIRVAIGPLVLGELAKGAWRELTADEATALAPLSVSPSARPARGRP
ncbi:23S rRNA pseudouridine2605 synthase [Chiayiivirga flava]|uniref:Pseudouridine synthase n=1 Tax=Chiayiivirga flava TaxID=659595 RepID=A0A7W8D3M6_9GAMM|nr:23S rRNA pseudouridine2605 synthase [Chiayiivirga flava]